MTEGLSPKTLSSIHGNSWHHPPCSHHQTLSHGLSQGSSARQCQAKSCQILQQLQKLQLKCWEICQQQPALLNSVHANALCHLKTSTTECSTEAQTSSCLGHSRTRGFHSVCSEDNERIPVGQTSSLATVAWIQGCMGPPTYGRYGTCTYLQFALPIPFSPLTYAIIKHMDMLAWT